MPILEILTGFSVLFLVVDWLQTRYIATHTDRYYETNFILGIHPSVMKVNVYFAVCVAAVLALYVYLGQQFAMSLNVGFGLLAAFEAYITYRNYKLGIKFA